MLPRHQWNLFHLHQNTPPVEETTPIRTEMFPHRIKVWSLRTTFYWFAVTLSSEGITGPKPWQQSRATVSDHLPAGVKQSDLYHSLHICTYRLIENMLKDDSSQHHLFPHLCRAWFLLLNAQMCTHLYNEGFIHCSPTIISPSAIVDGLFLLKHSDNVLRRRSRSPKNKLPPCFFLRRKLMHEHRGLQMCSFQLY